MIKAMTRFLFVQSVYENIGVEFLSANLKKHGHQVELVFFPFNVGKISENKKILERLKTFQPNVVAFSPFSVQYDWSRNKAAMIKKIYPKQFILFGGVHVNSVPELVMRDKMIDGILLGEGDRTIVEFADNWEKRKIERTPSLWYRKSGKVVKNSLAPLENELDQFPFPDKELFYSQMPKILKKIHYTAIGSRGCPYACSYCSNNVFQKLYTGQKRLRYRSPENFIEEIKQAKKKYGFSRVDFVDDVLSVDTKRLEKLMSLYKKNINLPFYCYYHPQLISPKVIKLLKKGGCEWLRLGLQSANEEYRHKYLNRFEKNDDVVRVSKLCRKYKLKFSFDHIFNLPGESKEHLIEAVALYNECRPTVINWAGLMYLPATTIIEYGLKFKTIKKSDIEKINTGIYQPVNLQHETSLFKRCENKSGINTSIFMLLFVMISIFPKNAIKLLLKIRAYNWPYRIPNILIIGLKIVSKIKAGQIYLYVDSFKISLSNAIQKRLFKYRVE
jgi:anaerobic magnesium-protoporphyrin IX monomethyl ester cyclase